MRIDRELAYALLVDGDFSAAIKAFMAGRIDVTGDMTALMTFAMEDDASMSTAASEVREQIMAFTS